MKPKLDPTSMIEWRHRLGEEGMEWLLTTVVESAVKSGVVDRSSFAHVSVDSTVMEKNITHPTDRQCSAGETAKQTRRIYAGT